MVSSLAVFKIFTKWLYQKDNATIFQSFKKLLHALEHVSP